MEGWRTVGEGGGRFGSLKTQAFSSRFPDFLQNYKIKSKNKKPNLRLSTCPIMPLISVGVKLPVFTTLSTHSGKDESFPPPPTYTITSFRGPKTGANRVQEDRGP